MSKNRKKEERYPALVGGQDEYAVTRCEIDRSKRTTRPKSPKGRGWIVTAINEVGDIYLVGWVRRVGNKA